MISKDYVGWWGNPQPIVVEEYIYIHTQLVATWWKYNAKDMALFWLGNPTCYIFGIPSFSFALFLVIFKWRNYYPNFEAMPIWKKLADYLILLLINPIRNYKKNKTSIFAFKGCYNCNEENVCISHTFHLYQLYKPWN